jgi:hypothetical protein
MIVICFTLVFLRHLSASGELRRVEILSHEPWLDSKPLGKAGAYEKVRGRAYFAVDPLTRVLPWPGWAGNLMSQHRRWR